MRRHESCFVQRCTLQFMCLVTMVYFATQDNDNAQVGMSMMENPNLMDAANFGGPQSPIGEYLPPDDDDSDGDGDYKIK